MTNTEQRSPLSRPGFIAAAIVVGIIVLAAIIVLVTSLTRGSDDNAAQPTEDPSTSSTPSAEASDESVCGLDGFEDMNTLTQAPENEWELVGTVAAPTEPEGAGPAEITDGLRTCYAHTAEGALFLAVNFAAMGTDASLRDRLPQLVAPGPGRDALIALGSDSSGSTLRAQVAGYSIGSYSAKETTVDLAVNFSSGELVSLPLKLVWAEGDWKIQMTDAGVLPLSPAPIDNLGGYTPWSGA
ncbi:hypothetical protein D6T64_01615 [Cryobacterium melibiosiphilum]|uniref:DUF8175 domain-containing protein n=1 Tax=Cryobacterium melibiosiphilum TaxID=995039 RepID=A0A3A5MUN2_9MICO|nr:hypothetical protein [Cryobacterium melibiosiphilum]RJT91519.1 hypothetical protein D6T64_01615 [Cryobacterium melibiosiphilum]